VSGKDLKKARLSDVTDHITADAAARYSRVAPAGSVLVLVRGMGLQNGFALSFIERPMAFNQDLRALVPKPGISGRFLAHALAFAGRRMLQNVSDAAHGTKRLSQDDLNDFRIPVPDSAEQQTIGSVLDRARDAADLAELCETKAAALKRAAMRELFTRGLRGEELKETAIGPTPMSWNLTSIDDRFLVVSGGTPSRGVAAYWSSGTIPWVKTGEIDYSTINETEEHITAEGLEDSAARLLPRGTVLMAMYGQGLTRGRVGVLGIEAACNQACAALLPRDEQVLPRFVYYQLGHRYNEIRGLAHGGQQQNLNMDIVKALALSYPPDLAEQREIVEILDAIDQKIALHKRKKAVLEELFKALLHKLMTGEIRVSDLDLSALDDAPPAEASA
jgi:type I restriction enzyme S subunit